MSSSPSKPRSWRSPRPNAKAPHRLSLVGPDGYSMPQSIGLTEGQIKGPHGLVAVLRSADKEPTPAAALSPVETLTTRSGLFIVSRLPQILLATYSAGMQNHQHVVQAACLMALITIIQSRITALLDTTITDKKLREDLEHVLSVCDDPDYLDKRCVQNADGQPLPSPKLLRPLLTTTPDMRVVTEDGERFRNNKRRCQFYKHTRAQGWSSDDLTSHLHSLAVTMSRLMSVQGVQTDEYTLLFDALAMAASNPDATVQWASLVVDTMCELKVTRRLYQLYQALQVNDKAARQYRSEVYPRHSQAGIRFPRSGLEGSRCAEDLLTAQLVRAIRKRAVTI